MSQLRRKYHLNADVQKRGLTFAKCIVCESLKDLIPKVEKNCANIEEHEMKLKDMAIIKIHVDDPTMVGKWNPSNQSRNFYSLFTIR
jgi:hypothetical protein